jgi:hypothetical protein
VVVRCGVCSTSVDSRGGGEADAADMTVDGSNGGRGWKGEEEGGEGDLVFDLA